MSALPVVAPYQSCVACLKGDTTTAVALRGEAEWIVAGLQRLGVPRSEALGTFQSGLRELGWVGGADEVPSGELLLPVRVCVDCAARGGMKARELPEIECYGGRKR